MVKTQLPKTEHNPTAGEIPEEWRVEQVDELYDISSGLSKPRKEFGFGYPFLSFKDIFQNFSLLDDLCELVNSTEKERAKCSILRGDVFLTRTSETIDELGMSSVALKDYANATFNGFAKRLRPKTKDVVPEFAAYLFRSDNVRSQMFMFSSLTTRASLNAGAIKQIKVMLPPKPEQKSIAKILGDLDEKIELNQRMNKTMEAIAQANFKLLFLDLWSRNETTIDELVEFDPAILVKKGVILPHVDMKALSTEGMIVSDIVFKPFSGGSRFQNGDTLLARITPCLENGKTAFVNFLEKNNPICFGSTEFIVMRPKENVSPQFVYCLARALDFRAHAIKSMVGSSGRQRVQLNVLRSYQIPTPDQNSMDGFHKATLPLFQKINENRKEIQTLKKIRDSLLPRLMSGRIRVGVYGNTAVHARAKS